MKTVLQRLMGLGIGLAFVVGLATLIWTPTFTSITQAAIGSDRVLLAEDGQVLQVLRTDFSKRRLGWYPLDNFPQLLRKAVISAEDQRFESHPGIDPLAFARAFVRILQGGRLQGASTITMQVSDLISDRVLLHNERIQKGSIAHKLVQIWRALRLELRWSKAQILEAYLNLIHLRGEHQGVAAMSQAYFGKHPLGLNQYEAAVIAALIPNPNQGRSRLVEHACRLSVSGSSDCSGVTMAVDQMLSRPPAILESETLAPHLARRLFQQMDKTSIVKSTLRRSLQEQVRAILQKNIAQLKHKNVGDSAAIVIDNRSGEVLAYVGAVDSSKNRHVDGVISPRQAGSTLKPFIYGQAIENKALTAASILLDDSTAISWSGGVYRPTNYDRHFYGPVSVREALASSLNVPAVKAVTIVGLHRTYKVMQSLRISDLKEPDFYGVSMALGAVDVRLEELANAYRMLANGGRWSPLRFSPQAEQQNPASEDDEQVLSAQTAYIVSSILSDPSARTIGFGWESPLETPFWTAVKTGTSKDYRDNWCVGFSERYTVAVWAGNFNAEAMRQISGVSGAGPSWYEIMSLLHHSESSSEPKPPDGIVIKKIRHQWASYDRSEYFLAGTEPLSDSLLIEPAPDKRIQFVFPAEGSILVKDPRIAQERVALFVRFKGHVPAGSLLKMDARILGAARSPYKIDDLVLGSHRLSIVAPDGRVMSKVDFKVR